MTPTLDTGAALLRAVLDEPDDDLPRLAYADLLEEQGRDAHAEFIRLQLARPAGHHGVGEVCDCRPFRCVYFLFPRCWPVLRGGEGPRAWNYNAMLWDCRRGFAERLKLTGEFWCKWADVFLATWPVREVTLTTRFRFGVVGGRPGLALFGEGRRLLRFIEPDADMPETLGEDDGPSWIVAKLWPGVAFILPFP